MVQEISKVIQVRNTKKVKFSNAKDFYYIFKISDELGIHDLAFTKRQLLDAQAKFNKIKDSIE